MSIDDIEGEVLKLDPQARARLAKKLLESLEALSEEENERLWAEEAKNLCRSFTQRRQNCFVVRTSSLGAATSW